MSLLLDNAHESNKVGGAAIHRICFVIHPIEHPNNPRMHVPRPLVNGMRDGSATAEVPTR